MSAQLTPSKRQHDRRHTEPNGKGKRHKSSFNPQNIPLKVSPGSSMFRVLCFASKIGSVIGKSGSIISQIRQETGAKIRIDEVVSGSDERVIVIIGSDKESEVAADRSKEDIAETTNVAEVGDDVNEQTENGENKESICVEDLSPEKGMSSVQKALLLVFESMVKGESLADGRGGDDSDKSARFVMRLLVHSSQVGCLLGEGGSVIKKMSSDSGAEIQIIPTVKLPSCATPGDELLQINGGVDTVRRALQSVSRHLLENSPPDLGTIFANSSGPSSHSFGNHVSRVEVFPPPNYDFPHQRAPYAPGMNPIEDIMIFRLLCPDEKVGGVIGKAGTVVRTLQHETGCEIKVQDRLPGSDDRIIVISGHVRADERISAAQDAVLRVFSRIAWATPERKENTPSVKLIVSSHQIGCLLGKGGSVIAEMRKSSGAHIRILGKDQFPNGASDNEIVQVSGDFERVQDALMHITTRLRDNLFRNGFPPMDHPFNLTFPDQPPRFPSYGGMELSQPGMYSSFHKFDGVGTMPPHGGFQPHDDHPPFMHNIRRPGMPHNVPERNPLSTWGPQVPTEGGGPLAMPEYAGAPQRMMGGFGGGSHLAIITNTTVEVVVPRSVVPVIYGEDGGCLKRIREISDAKVTITDPKPGANETKITISGTPEQTHAAQSLIQAFVLSEAEAS